MNREELELSRSSCTPAQFCAYVRAQIKKKKISSISPSDIDLDYWRKGSDLNSPYHEHYGVGELSVSKPYESQTYVKNLDDGTVYNCIMEFSFYDEKTGSGYFYLLNEME